MLNKTWLKQTREQLGLTQQEVADEMFVTKQTISSIERGLSWKKSTVVVFERILLEHLGKEDYSI